MDRESLAQAVIQEQKKALDELRRQEARLLRRLKETIKEQQKDTPTPTPTPTPELKEDQETTDHVEALKQQAQEDEETLKHLLAQESEDHVESLKQQAIEADDEVKRLENTLEQRKSVLKWEEREKKGKEPAVEYVIKEGRRKRKN
ncbi:hypothetical protein N0V83_010421 [Neocucurbitaria cava]|uniref:Uncharacterized protein n=1 Tax=Neocucurbitaria cava TaxID=798079 RepID=A0A9W8XYH3_9PLEO|nr:hypothetical protein N0V83_010421 [Neocucurbitaria cava]